MKLKYFFSETKAARASNKEPLQPEFSAPEGEDDFFSEQREESTYGRRGEQEDAPRDGSSSKNTEVAIKLHPTVLEHTIDTGITTDQYSTFIDGEEAIEVTLSPTKEFHNSSWEDEEDCRSHVSDDHEPFDVARDQRDQERRIQAYMKKHGGETPFDEGGVDAGRADSVTFENIKQFEDVLRSFRGYSINEDEEPSQAGSDLKVFRGIGINDETYNETLQVGDVSIHVCTEEKFFRQQEEKTQEIDRQFQKLMKQYNEGEHSPPVNDSDEKDVSKQLKKLMKLYKSKSKVPELTNTINGIVEVDMKLQRLLRKYKKGGSLSSGSSAGSASIASAPSSTSADGASTFPVEESLSSTGIVDSNQEKDLKEPRDRIKMDIDLTKSHKALDTASSPAGEKSSKIPKSALPPPFKSNHSTPIDTTSTLARKSGIIRPKVRVQAITSPRENFEEQCFPLNEDPLNEYQKRALKFVPLYSRRPRTIPRMSEGPVCNHKYFPNLHADKMACERCMHLATAEENKKLEDEGRHLRIIQVRGGCDRNCNIFPREKDEQPARLCAKCFHETHYGLPASQEEQELLK